MEALGGLTLAKPRTRSLACASAPRCVSAERTPARAAASRRRGRTDDGMEMRQAPEEQRATLLVPAQVEGQPSTGAELKTSGMMVLQGSVVRPEPLPVPIVSVATLQREGPLITRVSCVSLGLMLTGQVLGLVATSQYARAYSTPSENLLVCSEETGTCSHHYFTSGWCRPGSVVAYSSSSADGTRTDQGERGSCGPYAIGQACVTDANLAQCRGLLDAGCNADNVVAMESCPLQFSCASELLPEEASVADPSATDYVSSTSSIREELPCPEDYVDPNALLAEGIVLAVLIASAVCAMATFPGACTCCVLGDGCSGRTTARIVAYVLSLSAIGLTVVIGLALGVTMHQGDLDPIPPGVFAVGVNSCPLVAFGGLTLARYISQTLEGTIADTADSTIARRNHRQCALISGAIAVLSILAPVVVYVSTKTEDGGVEYGGAGYGYWGEGQAPPPPQCQLAAVVQQWHCSGCNGVILNTLNAGGTPPDSTVSRVVAQWRFEAVDAPEPATSIHAMYPWLNPVCADIGVHSGRDYCREDSDALLAMEEDDASSQVPSQVPQECASWFDGCNTCSIDGDSMVCSLAACPSMSRPFCQRFMGGMTCDAPTEPGCDPSTHQGRIDYSDPQVKYELLSMVMSWDNQCPSASTDTCTPVEAPAGVTCVVWEPQIMYGRPFLTATDSDLGVAHTSLQANVRVEVDSDWIMGGFEL